MIVCAKDETEIKTITEWHEKCHPVKKDIQWKDKRSAKELARYWTEGPISDFINFLHSYGYKFDSYKGYPEFGTKFDSYNGDRKNDLVIVPDNNEFFCSIEGKADESFGEKTFLDQITIAVTATKKNSDSDQIPRIMELYGKYFLYNKECLNLYYQLTYWFAGTIAETKRRGISKAVMIVQIFDSESLDSKKKQVNQQSLNKLVSIISNGEVTEIKENTLSMVICNEYTQGIELQIGKFVVQV